MGCDVRYTDQLERAMVMAAIALAAKNSALDTLTEEVTTLRKENRLLSQVVSTAGAEQVPMLLASLQQAEAQVEQLSSRLSEEVDVRERLEKELEDTAAAAQELWSAMQAMYEGGEGSSASRTTSRALSPLSRPLSRTNSVPPCDLGGSRPVGEEEEEEQEEEEWGTPSGAVSPASAAAAAAGRQPSTPTVLSAAAAAAAVAAAAGTGPTAAAAAADGDTHVNPAMQGILTPLENKLQSLSSKLVGLVAWLDTRDTASQASTPRSLTPRTAVAAAAGSVSPAAHSSGGRGRACSVTPLALGRLHQVPAADSLDGSTLFGSPPAELAAKLMAAAAAAGRGRSSGPDGSAVCDGVARLKLSPRDGRTSPCGATAASPTAAAAAAVTAATGGASKGVVGCQADQSSDALLAGGFLMGDVQGMKDT